jgi:hypothetical protein
MKPGSRKPRGGGDGGGGVQEGGKDPIQTFT